MEKHERLRLQRLVKPAYVDRCWPEITKKVREFGLKLVDDSSTTGGFYIVLPEDDYPGDGYYHDSHGDDSATRFRQFRNYCGADNEGYTEPASEINGYEFMVWGKITKREMKCLQAIIDIVEQRYGIQISIDIF